MLTCIRRNPLHLVAPLASLKGLAGGRSNGRSWTGDLERARGSPTCEAHFVNRNILVNPLNRPTAATGPHSWRGWRSASLPLPRPQCRDGGREHGGAGGHCSAADRARQGPAGERREHGAVPRALRCRPPPAPSRCRPPPAPAAPQPAPPAAAARRRARSASGWRRPASTTQQRTGARTGSCFTQRPASATPFRVSSCSRWLVARHVLATALACQPPHTAVVTFQL